MTMTTTQTNSSSLSDWAAPYVTDMLGQAQALGDPNNPFPAYTGATTAPLGQLTQQASSGLASLNPGQVMNNAGALLNSVGDQYQGFSYTPATFTTGTFDNTAAQRYMNPYIQQALQPQIDQLNKDAQIQKLQDDSRLTQAGAFGGSRQAIMDAARENYLSKNIADYTGKGYAAAYDNARDQFNQEQNRGLKSQEDTEQSYQFGTNAGLQALAGATNTANTMTNYGHTVFGDQMTAGGLEQATNQKQLDSDQAQWQKQVQYPYQQLQFQKDMLSGLPISTQSTSVVDPNFWSQMLGGLIALNSVSSSGQSKAKGGIVKSKAPAGLQALALRRIQEATA